MAKPAVDGLERDLEAQGVNLVRLNVGQQVGAVLARDYGVRAVPALIVFDGEGTIVLRQVGRIQAGEALDAVRAAVAATATGS